MRGSMAVSTKATIDSTRSTEWEPTPTPMAASIMDSGSTECSTAKDASLTLNPHTRDVELGHSESLRTGSRVTQRHLNQPSERD